MMKQLLHYRFLLTDNHLDTVTFWYEALINLSCAIEHLYNLLLCFYALQWQGIHTQPLFLLMLLAGFDSLCVLQFLVDPSESSLEMWPEKIFQVFHLLNKILFSMH